MRPGDTLRAAACCAAAPPEAERREWAASKSAAGKARIPICIPGRRPTYCDHRTRGGSDAQTLPNLPQPRRHQSAVAPTRRCEDDAANPSPSTRHLQDVSRRGCACLCSSARLRQSDAALARLQAAARDRRVHGRSNGRTHKPQEALG